MGYWRNVGILGNSHIFDFLRIAKEITRSEGFQGSLARLFIAEPTAGSWGDMQRDLPRFVLEELVRILRSPNVLTLTPEGLKEAEPDRYPEIEEALENGKVMFLVGRARDERRHVAIYLLN